MSRPPYRPTFYLTINTLFLLVILVVGGGVAWHSYRDTREIILTEADRDYDRTLETISSNFQRSFSPIYDTVRLMSKTTLMAAKTREERLRRLDLLKASLQGNRAISGMQIGYANGDYLIMRPLASDRVRTLFQAPDGAVFVVDHIATEAITNRRLMERSFHDEDLREIARLPAEVTAYDPRQRPWYQQATAVNDVRAVKPYLFFFLKEIGTTISVETPGTGAVVGADVALSQLSDALNRYLLTPGAEIALLDANGYVLGYGNPARSIISHTGERVSMVHIRDLGSEVFALAAANDLLHPGMLHFDAKGRTWYGAAREFKLIDTSPHVFTLVMLTPLDELLGNANSQFRHSLFVTLLLLGGSIPCAVIIAHRISRALTRLAAEAGAVGRFDFNQPVSVRSRIKEIDELAVAMDSMKNTISRFLDLLKALAGERNFDAMLGKITEETLQVSAAAAALTWFVDDATGTLRPAALVTAAQGKIAEPGLPQFPVGSTHPLVAACRSGEVGRLRLRRGEAAELGVLFETLQTEELTVATFPLKNRKGEELGLLCLLQTEADNPAANGRGDFVRTFSGFASVSLESRHLLEMQKRLLEAFIHLLAGAIDAKSPYTGGHCQRVPVLAKMLAQAACDDQGKFRDFTLDDEGWEALHLAGWLHDCGKVTTPEYVVDKATKLETIYNRIHEIRTRFEVLRRDAEISFWQQVVNGGNREQLQLELDAELQSIEEDFHFVAQCNIGDEAMAPEKATRLEAIAARTWLRHLDNRLGISWEEEKRHAGTPKPTLPVEERVLADRDEHLIERDDSERIPVDNPWGFKLTAPVHRYNLGELYNLKVERGTLTAEERYKINDHIVQTIIMLSKLPYPRHLRDVPAIAGSHHEKMDGKGYPKQLRAEEMSLPARMMAIADIFEALTAADRPYKKAKSLSEALRLMSFFVRDHHIDPDLFELFLTSGVYLDYARKYLAPEQIDAVDIHSYLGRK